MLLSLLIAKSCCLLTEFPSIWFDEITSIGRNSAFGKLGSWPVELVVERSLASSTMPLSPSNALLRVFEVILMVMTMMMMVMIVVMTMMMMMVLRKITL